jgi:hypothetical protein
LAVHADARIVIPGTDHIDPSAWHPLIYNFRHYFGLGAELGHSFRSETADPPLGQAPLPGAGSGSKRSGV